jgi:hypothetical protein
MFTNDTENHVPFAKECRRTTDKLTHNDRHNDR